MLTKDPRYDEITQSRKTIIINGEKWYRIEDLPQNENYEDVLNDTIYVEPTLLDRIEALEDIELERLLNG